MERISRIGFSGSLVRKLAPKFLKLGVKLKVSELPGGHDFTVFLVGENHPNFSEVMRIVRDNDLSFLSEAKFSRQDYQEASHVTLFGMPKTFPSPSDNFWSRTTTYDTSRMCRSCGVGLKQIAPFRFEREVRLKEKEIIGLHWIFGEVFVSPALASEVFSRFGIETREVLNSNGKRILVGVRQVVVPEICVPVDGTGLEVAKCSSCSSEKNTSRHDMFFPRLMEFTDAPIFKTAQYFGSGIEANRRIVINKALYSALIVAKTKSMITVPLAS